MAKAATLYVCTNTTTCTLGTAGGIGRFTGGMLAEQKHLLTGRPLETLEEGTDYGEGICPNCGQPGEQYDPEKAKASAIAEAEAQHKAHIEAIKGGVA